MRNATRIIAASFGVFAGIGGLEHGYFELLQLFGGGIFPPLIGIIGGAAGTRIHAPLKKQPGPIWSLLAKMWPWTIIVFFVWLFGQFVIGYFFNEFLMENVVLWAVLFLGLLVVSILSGYGHDVVEQGRVEV